MKKDNVYLQFAYLGDCKICKEPVYGTPPKENCDRFNFHPVVHSECYRKKEKAKLSSIYGEMKKEAEDDSSK